MPLAAPKTFAQGRFKVQRELGRGGMGVVYEALDKESNVCVALKTLLHVNAEEIYRLKKEFRALQDIVHPNLCGLGELVEEHGRWFFAMELIDGEDFLTYTTGNAKDPGSLQSAVKQVLPHSPGGWLTGDKEPWQGFDEVRLRTALSGVVHGMVALHSAGKVHRDVKPTNVIVTEEGRAVLLDFGLIIETAESRKPPGRARQPSATRRQCC